MIREKDPRNPPRIPQLRFKKDLQSRVKQRDLDGLLQSATPRRVNEWQDVIGASTPEALPFTLFGLHYASGSESPQTHPSEIAALLASGMTRTCRCWKLTPTTEHLSPPLTT